MLTVANDSRNQLTIEEIKNCHQAKSVGRFEMEALLKNLKKYVECSICLESFTEPKTITCLHTFCCECLKKHALTSQRDGQFRCPECQTQIAIPKRKKDLISYRPVFCTIAY